MIDYVWLVPAFPLVAFILILFFGRSLKERSAWLGVLFMLASFVVALAALIQRLGVEQVEPVNFEWLSFGHVVITMGYELTPLNALMLFIVSLVSLLVHIYARGYMAGDERIHVFYMYLALFTFSMLGLVLSPNLLQLYIFWELVGVCSFLLIGFYFYKPEAKQAAKKAFIMTRIGDVGLFAAIILLFWQVGSFEFAEIFAAVENNQLSPGFITVTALLIFWAAVGKSGQFPLHSWLPDAMEGPTPVSALIHAATMVAAGVYLVAALFPLFGASPLALDVVAYVGAFTAIFAATIGLVQNDIKRVLAYSTVSQLGYMMLALGAAGYVAGVFHLYTHAFFKAMLFLAAGSVIHAVHTQDIRQMGGLYQAGLKVTGILFLIGCLAIAGIPPFAGFFSKEEILLTAWQAGRPGVFLVALLTAFITALYMFRLFFMVFGGKRRGGKGPIQEAPAVMTWPMIVLAVLTVIGGFVHTHWTGTFLGDWLKTGPAPTYGLEATSAAWILILALLVSLAGIGLAYWIYIRQPGRAEGWATTFSGPYRVLLNKYYVDEAYQVTLVRGLSGLSVLLAWIDRYIIDGLVRLAAWVPTAVGQLGARMQNGQVQRYGVTVFIGLVVIILAVVLSGGMVQ